MNGVVSIPLAGIGLATDNDSPTRGTGAVAVKTFVAGPENRLPAIAVLRMARGTGGAAWRSGDFGLRFVGPDFVGPDFDALVSKATFAGSNECISPLVLCGPSGTGKSLLVQALVDDLHRHDRSGLVRFTAVDFARQFADGLERHTLDRWRVACRAASLFIIEDLGHMVAKPAAEEELARTLDSLGDAGARVVVTSRLAPDAMPRMSPRLLSRLQSGLVVGLAPPGSSARLEILRQLAAARGMQIDDDAARLLAERFAMGVAELGSALAQIALVVGDGARIDARLARQQIAARFTTGAATLGHPSVHDIALRTARHFNLRIAELRGPVRRQAVVRARDVAMYLARQLTGRTLEQIGDYFGGRDHTTVAHGCRKVEQLLQSDSAVLQGVAGLRQLLTIE